MNGLTWCVVPPSTGPYARLPGIGPPTTAAQIAELRGRVLFDGGRRPSFRDAEGRYDDPDPLDRHAFLIGVRQGGDLVGCIRTNPTSTSPPSSMASALGPKLLEEVVGALGVAQRECWDGGRWTVDPSRQRAAIGGELACAAMAVARYFGGRRLVGVAGLRGRQAERLVSLGARYVAACPVVEAKGWDDELRVVAFDLDHVERDVGNAMAVTTELLDGAWPEAIHRILPLPPPATILPP